MKLRSAFLGSLALCGVVLWASAPASAKKPAKLPPPACGLAALNLIPGQTWTFRGGVAEVTVAVLEVSAGKSATEIKVEETFGPTKSQATWTCTPKEGLTMGPDSFFFVGEPGGVQGGTFSLASHESVSFPPDAGLAAVGQYSEILKGALARSDASGSSFAHKPATFEIERHVTTGASEPVVVPYGSYTAQKLVFELRGRGLVEGEKFEIPVKRPGSIWLAKGVGIVKIDDSFDKTWELVNFVRPGADPAAAPPAAPAPAPKP